LLVKIGPIAEEAAGGDEDAVNRNRPSPRWAILSRASLATKIHRRAG
jgi:hypothetical protein